MYSQEIFDRDAEYLRKQLQHEQNQADSKWQRVERLRRQQFSRWSLEGHVDDHLDAGKSKLRPSTQNSSKIELPQGAPPQMIDPTAIKEALMYESLERLNKMSTDIGLGAAFRMGHYSRNKINQSPSQATSASRLHSFQPSRHGNSWFHSNHVITADDRKRLKAIALVSPQYCGNDSCRKKGFTEWTLLKNAPRTANGIATRLPHSDVGYYNYSDIRHRRYMRVLADHFGIYGFCFYHFWSKVGPVLPQPLDALLQDGEPNKPFFLTWANSLWTDGVGSEPLDYADSNDNNAHFHYLLPIFRHKKYICISGMPVFSFSRVDIADIPHVEDLMELWNDLAVKAGLKGIFFLEFSTSQAPSLALTGVFSARVALQPMHSWVHASSGPSIHHDGGADISATFRAHNPAVMDELQRRGISLEHFMSQFPMMFDFMTSQFKVYNRKLSWKAAENADLSRWRSSIRSAFCHWSNVPRRNSTSQNYGSYPQMMTPNSISGCRRHLDEMAKVVLNDRNGTTEKILILNSWNQWDEQSAFEPNDVDGYDSLSAAKRVFRSATGRTIYHVGASLGGDVAIYIRDLSRLFDHYDHVALPTRQSKLDKNAALLHLHGISNRGKSDFKGTIDFVRKNKDQMVPVYITVHDFQLLFPKSPILSSAVIKKMRPEKRDVKYATELLRLTDLVIFPSNFMKNYFVNALGNNLTNDTINRFQVVPHNDILENSDRFRVPLVQREIVNVGFVGPFTKWKGSTGFIQLLRQGSLDRSTTSGTNKENISTFKFHVFGGVRRLESCTHAFCQTGNDDHKKLAVDLQADGVQFYNELNEDWLSKIQVHILIYLSQFVEPYCMELSHGITSGLPIVYMNTGAIKERLSGLRRPGLFPINAISDLGLALSKASDFVLTNQGALRNFYYMSSNLQPSRWYIENYPIPA